MLAQGEPEADEAEIVALVRRAGEERPRADAGVPAAREAEQPAADDDAGEVLLGDRELARLPAVADVAQVGQHDVPQHGREAEGREEPVEHGLGLDVAERLERRAELRLGRRERAGALGAGLSGGAGSRSATRAAAAADRPCASPLRMARTRASSSAV